LSGSAALFPRATPNSKKRIPMLSPSELRKHLKQFTKAFQKNSQRIFGVPRRTRTFGLCLRRAVLYPAELWEHLENDRLFGAPGRTRTSNPKIRNLVLYPIELQVHLRTSCADYGAQTVLSSTDSVLPQMVPGNGIEPLTRRFSAACSTN
jgi:hypothetical protein